MNLQPLRGKPQIGLAGWKQQASRVTRSQRAKLVQDISYRREGFISRYAERKSCSSSIWRLGRAVSTTFQCLY